MSFYKFVFKNSQFKLYKYEVNGKSVAYNVCYYSEIQRVIYDVAFPWTTYADTYRLGIFSIIVNLKEHLMRIGDTHYVMENMIIKIQL